jgi:hypothetical protein
MAMMTQEEHWDILSPVEESTSTTSYEYYQILEQQGGSNIPNSQQLFVFEMRDQDAFVKASDSYLYGRVRIDSDASGTAYNKLCSFMNTGMLFSRGDYLIDGVIIETVENLHYSTLVRDLIDYSEDFSKAGAADQLFFKDGPSPVCNQDSLSPYASNTTDACILVVGADGVVTATTDGTTEVADGKLIRLSDTYGTTSFNDGWRKRAFLSCGQTEVLSYYVPLRIPLRRLFGYCTLNRITTGTRHTVRLTRNSPAACTVGTDGATFVNFNHLSIFYAYLKPSYTQLSLLTDQLSKSSRTKLSFETANCYRKPFQAGSTINWEVSSISERINKVVVFLIPTEILASVTGNKGIFHHAKVSRAYIKVGSFRYPHSQDFTPGFADPTTNTSYGWNNLYNEYLRCANKNMSSDTGPCVGYQEFKDIYPMFCFDVRNQDENLFGVGNRPQDLRVELTLGEVLVDYTAFCVVFSERVIVQDIVNRSTKIDRI